MAKRQKVSLSPNTTELVLGLAYLAAEFLLLPWLLDFISGLLPTPLSPGWRNVVFYCINFLAVLLIFHRFLRNNLSHLSKNLWESIKALILGYVFYWVLNWAVSWALMKLFPGFSNINDRSLYSMLRENFWPLALCIGFLVPLTEETLFRGVFFGGLYHKNRAIAFTVSTAVFSLIHILGYLGAASPAMLAACFIQYLPAGLCLAWSYMESGSIFVPTVIHTVINVTGLAAMR